MWVKSERAGYANCWYYIEGSFISVRMPSNSLVHKDSKGEK